MSKRFLTTSASSQITGLGPGASSTLQENMMKHLNHLVHGLDCTEGVIDVVVDVKLCLTNVILLGNKELACQDLLLMVTP